VIQRSIVIVVALLIAGCVSAPPVEPPTLDVSIPATWITENTQTGQLDSDWWKAFEDSELTNTVETALANNYDLKAAAARVQQAAAAATIEKSSLQPNLQTGLGGSRRQQNFVGFPIPGAEDRVLSTISTNWGVSLDVSWELDLWNRLQAGAQAALADLQASGADLRSAQLSIAGQTVKAWISLAEMEQQVRLTRKTVVSYSDSANQVRDRFEAGLRSALDLRLALLSLANAEALLQQQLQQHDAGARQLQLLIGGYANGRITLPDGLPVLSSIVPAGLPAELIFRRPDLLAAERRLAASQARLSMRKSDLLPRFSLTGSTGTATDALRSLVNGDFTVWSLLGDVIAPLWQGGRLRAAIDQEEARVAETLASYANVALRAFAEVETALAAETFFNERKRHLDDSVQQAHAAERLAEERYRAGLDTFIPVLESQRSAAQAESALLTSRRLRLENRVDLYLALGGGFDQLESPFDLSIDNNDQTIRP
jgi:multidrug efflux system outer membrane protein